MMSALMNIILYIDCLNGGGAARSAVNFATGYSLLGCKVVFLYNSITEDGYKIRRETIADFYQFQDFMSVEKDNFSPDLVHIHSHDANKDFVFLL